MKNLNLFHSFTTFAPLPKSNVCFLLGGQDSLINNLAKCVTYCIIQVLYCWNYGNVIPMGGIIKAKTKPCPRGVFTEIGIPIALILASSQLVQLWKFNFLLKEEI